MTTSLVVQQIRLGLPYRTRSDQPFCPDAWAGPDCPEPAGPGSWRRSRWPHCRLGRHRLWLIVRAAIFPVVLVRALGHAEAHIASPWATYCPMARIPAWTPSATPRPRSCPAATEDRRRAAAAGRSGPRRGRRGRQLRQRRLGEHQQVSAAESGQRTVPRGGELMTLVRWCGVFPLRGLPPRWRSAATAIAAALLGGLLAACGAGASASNQGAITLTAASTSRPPSRRSTPSRSRPAFRSTSGTTTRTPSRTRSCPRRRTARRPL